MQARRTIVPMLVVGLLLGCSGGGATVQPPPPRTPIPLRTRPPVSAFGLCSPLAFARPVTSVVGQAPSSIAVGDLNGDQKPDLVVVDSTADSITVLSGDGLGAFAQTPSSPFFVGRGPLFSVVGEFNADDKADLAVVSSRSDDVAVLLGDGTGSLSPAAGSPYAVGTGPSAIAAGDFNRDSRLDLAVGIAGGSDAGVAVLLGDGTGRLSTAPGSPLPLRPGPTPVSLAVDDFDRDGALDVVAVTRRTDELMVLLGDYAGGFKASPRSSYAVGGGPEAVAVGDFDADGALDLATVNSRTNDVIVLLGDGAGGFRPGPHGPYPIIAGPISITADDVDGDGKLDLMVVVLEADDVTFLLGDGSGTFTEMRPPPRVITGGRPANSNLPFAQFIAASDLNGDRKPDLVTANPGSSDVSVLLNACR